MTEQTDDLRAPIAIHRGVRTATKRRYPAEILTRDEIRRLLATFDLRYLLVRRDHALTVLLWRTGLRISEALDLRPDDLDPVAGVRVRNGKGARARTVGIDPEALDIVDTYRVRRDRRWRPGPEVPLFCTRYLGTIDLHQSERMLRRRGAMAGIRKRVHPHGLRHTHAAELAREGVPIHVIRKQLGHASLATTQIYIDHLAPTDVVDAIRSRSPW